MLKKRKKKFFYQCKLKMKNNLKQAMEIAALERIIGFYCIF